jgi:hypothetical protein
MNKDQFYIEEYKTLKAELLANVEESIKLEIYALGATAAVYAWLVSQEICKVIIWFLPFILCLFGSIRSYALIRRVEHIAKYISEEIEKKNDCPGWETYFRDNKKTLLSATVYIFWLGLLFITIVAPFFLWN